MHAGTRGSAFGSKPHLPGTHATQPQGRVTEEEATRETTNPAGRHDLWVRHPCNGSCQGVASPSCAAGQGQGSQAEFLRLRVDHRQQGQGQRSIPSCGSDAAAAALADRGKAKAWRARARDPLLPQPADALPCTATDGRGAQIPSACGNAAAQRDVPAAAAGGAGPAPPCFFALPRPTQIDPDTGASAGVPYLAD
jgi:hypothetical protein